MPCFSKPTDFHLNDIANYWAKEVAHLRDGLNLQAIRGKLFMSLRGDDMAIAQPLREEAPKDLRMSMHMLTHIAFTSIWGYPLPITGELLGKVMVPVPGATTEFRNLDNYNEVSKKVWFDEVTVGQEGFGFWCDDQGHQRPTFWFGNQPGLKRSAQRKGPRQLTSKDIAIRKMIVAVEATLKKGLSKNTAIAYFSKGPHTIHKDFNGATLTEDKKLITWTDADGERYTVAPGTLGKYRTALKNEVGR